MKAPAVHVYDVATMNGSDLWMVGSVSAYDTAGPGGGAAAYRSTDGGADLADRREGHLRRRERFRALLLGRRDQRHDVPPGRRRHGGRAAACFQRHHLVDASWFLGRPCGTVAANRVEVFKNRIVCAGGTAFGVTTFDGVKSVTAAIGALSDLAVPGDGYIYALTNTGVHRSLDGTSWTPLSTAPTGAQSVAVVNGTVYLGMSDSTILKINKLTASPATSS